MQSYLIYISKLFWPGKMMSLHMLVSDEMGHPYVEPRMIALSIACFVCLTAVAIAAFFYGRRYVTFGWLWYVGTLVPVIGFVQVGEQGYADRYTYIPYIGLFVAIVWAIADLLDRFRSLRRLLVPVVSLAARRHRRLVDLLDELSDPDLARRENAPAARPGCGARQLEHAQ